MRQGGERIERRGDGMRKSEKVMRTRRESEGGMNDE